MNPNDVIGTPRDIWVWLAPDWSSWQEGDKAPAGSSGWTRVKIRETVHQDGRIVRNVLDANGTPVSADGTPSGGTAPARELDPVPEYDPKQAARWKEQQTAAGRADQEGDTRGPQTGPTREVYRGGQWVVEPNPVYTPPAASNPNDPTNRNAAELQRQRERNAALPPGQDPAYETDAERRARAEARIKQQGQDARQAQQDAQAQAARPGTKIGSKTEVRNGRRVTVETWRLPDGSTEDRVSEEPEKPSDHPSPYSQTVQDPETKKWWGLKKDGSGWVEIPGGPGAPTGKPTSPGPALPTIVVGQSQAALRTFRDQLQAEVASGRQTQAWADKRWEEAKDVAANTIQEATLLQRERESSLNANVNLATTRLNAETSGIKTALEFATSINGKLPEGSPLGGQAFAALLGLNMLAAKRSGIYDIKPPGSDQRSLEGRGIESAAGTATATTNSEITRLLNPGNPQAVAAQRAEVQAQLEQEAATQAAPVASATQDPISDPRGAGVLPPSAQPAVTAQPAPYQQGQPGTVTYRDQWGNTWTTTPAMLQTRPGGMEGISIVQETPPAATAAPQASIQPPQQQPTEDFAVLSAYRPQQQPQAPQEPVQPQMTPQAAQQEEMPAMRRARIAATPFWRLDDADIQWAEENGFGEDAMRVPSMRVA